MHKLAVYEGSTGLSISKPPFEMAFHFITFVRPEDVDGFMIKPAGMLLI